MMTSEFLSRTAVGIACMMLVCGVSGTLGAADPEKAEQEKPTLTKPVSPKTLGELGGSIKFGLEENSQQGLVIDNAKLKELGADGVLSEGGDLGKNVKLPERTENPSAGLDHDKADDFTLSGQELGLEIKAMKRAEAQNRREMLKADPERKKILRQQIARLQQKRRALERGAHETKPDSHSAQ